MIPFIMETFSGGVDWKMTIRQPTHTDTPFTDRLPLWFSVSSHS